MSKALPLKVYSAAQIRAMDAAIIASGVPGFELMQRAADALWSAVLARWPAQGCLSVLCGAGNNAGDGYLVALLAARAGWRVQVYSLSDPAGLQGDARQAWQAALAGQVPVQPWQPGTALQGVVIDAMLGTGLKGAVREPYAQAIDTVNACSLPVVAVDLPSGLDADRGLRCGKAIRADLTVTFIGLKLGLLTAEGPDHVGQLECASLAAKPEGDFEPIAQRLDIATWAQALPPRPRAAHKGLYGHVVLVGGERGMGGAIMLAAETALRSGAGRVSVVTRPEHVAPLLSRCPEIMVLGADDPATAVGLFERADVLVVGPGLGSSDWSRSLLDLALQAELPMLLDADALNMLAQESPRQLGARCIITPHPAEAARLLGCTTAQIQADRLQALGSLVERFGCAVVIKGVGSLVAAVDDQARPVAICTDGNPGMATAGMGDVLSGLAGALLGQGLLAGDALRYAVLVHALAGDQAARGGYRGLLASDLIMPIKDLLNLRNQS